MTDNPQPWFDKAQNDLEMARRALMPSKPLPDMACYHAQQCAEKYLKGYLVWRQVEFRWVHDLIYLMQLCQAQDSSFNILLDAADVLNSYATEVRYPVETEAIQPDQTGAEEAIRLAEQIVDFIKDKVDSDI